MAEEDGDEDEAVVVHAEEHSGCEQLEVDREGDSKQRKVRRGTEVTEEVAATVHTGQTDRLTDCSGAASSHLLTDGPTCTTQLVKHLHQESSRKLHAVQETPDNMMDVIRPDASAASEAFQILLLSSDSSLRSDAAVKLARQASPRLNRHAEEEDAKHTAGKHAFGGDVPRLGEEARVDRVPVPEHRDFLLATGEARER